MPFDAARSATVIANVVESYRESDGTPPTDPNPDVGDIPFQLPPMRQGIADRGGDPDQVASRTSGGRMGGSPAGGGSTQPAKPRPTGQPDNTGRREPGRGVENTGKQPGTPSSQNPSGTTKPSTGTKPPVNTKPPTGTKPSTNTKPPTDPVNPTDGRRPGGRPITPRPPPTPGTGGGVPNDNGEGAIVLVPRLQVDGGYLAIENGHNIGATGGAGENAGRRTNDRRQAFYGKSVWWVMVVPKDGTYDIIADTAGSNIDTTLSVYPPGRPNPISNDNNPDRPGPASKVTIRRAALKAGQKISVAVDGVNGAEGRIRISVRLKPAK